MITTFQLEINSCSESYKTIFSPTINDKWKIGQTYQIKWEPIDPSNNVNIFLMDKNITEGSASKSWQVENISNTGEYSFIVPQLPTGNKYQFYISSKEIMAYSDLFEISN
ncbi:MAG TPA: Ser-Thr-rich GPI-anchored membrane family protein [Candidatus Pacearchaeota archaeon]|nr:Ser-Thr-rich GPI-anchored membrane family protein [Candidatus Pacearchaeota archaeon]HQM24729.1 Ser-Thr-rich GPI-anchored membrane family protein [Candidatus Pacearchaeota archaeon]